MRADATADGQGRRALMMQGVAAAAAPPRNIVREYESLVLIYLTSLLYLYPYGIPLGSSVSIRAPDVLGLFCLLVGTAALVLKQRLRVDPVFLAVIGPFLVLELATPLIGAIGYRQPLDAVSSLRIAILWLPMILLTMLATRTTGPRFERKLRLLLTASLCLNVPYAFVEIAVDLGYAPAWMAFTSFLEPWAVDRHFSVVTGLRPAGFFVNTTALAVFGIVCLCYFYGQYVANRTRADLHLSLLSLLVVTLTTSRAGYAAAALIILIGWFALPGRRKITVFTVLALAVGALLLAIDRTIGIEQTFYRFQRLAESGLLADVSFGQRVRDTWPAALAVARDYPFGTLISAPRIAVLIDSGYLNYYIQGRWVFIASIAFMLMSQWVIGLWSLRKPYLRPGGLIILFLASYLMLGMIITNPLRSPSIISFIVFAFWKFRYESMVVRLRSVGHLPDD
jgi:O-antigen ligase